MLREQPCSYTDLGRVTLAAEVSMSALQQIFALLDRPDPYRSAPAGLRELQLEALRERFAEKRRQIPVLARRAKDTGIDEIRSLNDVVPLLFTHTNYKSYPEAFVDKGQWANMNLWLQTLSSQPVKNVDLNGVQDADDWLARLAAAGHHLFASSGTSGKCSFLNQTPADVDIADRAYQLSFDAQNQTFKAANDRPVFVFFPEHGVHRLCGPNAHFWHRVAAPGQLHFLSKEPLRAGPGIRAGQLRRAIAAGSALPNEIAAFDSENLARQRLMSAAMEDMVDRIHTLRHERMVLGVMWPAAFQLVAALRARGVQDGEFHPETVLFLGGGVKGVKLPDDFREQIRSFFGVPPQNYSNSYAMVEMTGLNPFIHHRQAYAVAPWIIPLILDKSGEKLLDPAAGAGLVEGRMALFDLLTDARWGGLISGDRVEVDFRPSDEFAGPLVRSIARYADLEEGEDKLTCAGTIDSYVRGSIAA
jgi:hypothetical protein